MKTWIYIAMLLVFAGCKKVNVDNINNLNGGRIEAIGHGGAGFQSYTNPYPTNSMSSISLAIDGYNADGVEVDVQLSKDNVLFLYHNEELQSSTNCFGCINETYAADLLQCKYNQNIGSNIHDDEYLVTLEQVMQTYANYTPTPIIYLDLRTVNNCDESNFPDKDTLAAKVVELIQRYGAHEWTVVINNSRTLLNKIQALDTNVRLMIEVEPVSLAIEIAVANGYEGLITENDDLNKDDVEAAHAAGIKVGLFSIRSQVGTIEAIEKHPDVIQTDNLELLLEYLY